MQYHPDAGLDGRLLCRWGPPGGLTVCAGRALDVLLADAAHAEALLDPGGIEVGAAHRPGGVRLSDGRVLVVGDDLPPEDWARGFDELSDLKKLRETFEALAG